MPGQQHVGGGSLFGRKSQVRWLDLRCAALYKVLYRANTTIHATAYHGRQEQTAPSGRLDTTRDVVTGARSRPSLMELVCRQSQSSEPYLAAGRRVGTEEGGQAESAAYNRAERAGKPHNSVAFPR